MGYGPFSRRCDTVAHVKAGSGLPGSSKGLSVAAFKSWMVARGYSPSSAESYGRALVLSMADPVEYMRNVTSHQAWLDCRAAWRLVARWTNDPAAWEAIRGLEGPRRPPRKVRPIPSLAEWMAIGRLVWKVPGPLGAICWLVVFSGMRIGDVLTLRPEEIQEGVGRGVTSCRQKGRGGQRRRSWTPGPLARVALERLAPERGYQWVWQLISRSCRTAEQIVNRRIPAPYTAHSFRHAVPTYLVALGIRDLPTIATITGHDSLSALERYIRTSVAVPTSRTYDVQSILAKVLLETETKDAGES